MILVMCVVVALDQLTKISILDHLELGESINVIPNFFDLTLVMNPGAAFGMFSKMEPGIRRVVLGMVTLLAIGLVLVLLKKEAKNDRISQFALFLVLGGAVGNIIDRFRFDAVVDFLDVYYGTYHWPAFNVADSAICVGVFVVIIRQTFFPEVKKEEGAENKTAVETGCPMHKSS